ncbi:hypothetical protein HNQ10_000221 [Deinococcus metallilatus]|uniref:PA14 domain-containing protein n=1 Tax=Deinococcus metallilatus TaxID=1211322 RepID=A0ABR6MN92_9DEIO|nr:hypothetical protein [Deinococcus metallilatus]
MRMLLIYAFTVFPDNSHEVAREQEAGMVRTFRMWWASLFVLSVVAALVGCGQAPTPAATLPAGSETLETQAARTTGLTGTYYNNMDFTGTSVTQIDATINKSWGTTAPVGGIDPTTYSIRWNGQITPNYNEEYTFYVTSSGGTRLFVNGHLIINDWSDHNKRTNNGIVKLLSGHKYDIRIDYFRGTVNSGTIQLEWSSKSQSKQIVPTAGMYPTGSNYQIALSALQGDPKFKLLGITPDPLKTKTVLLNNGSFFLYIPKPNKSGFIEAGVKDNKLIMLNTLNIDSSIITLTDEIGSTKEILGDVSLYINPDGSQTSKQKSNFEKRLVLFLNNNIYNSSSTQPSSTLTPQVITDGLCNLLLPPPPDCGGACASAALYYRNAVCGVAGFFEDGLIAVFAPEVGGALVIIDPEAGSYDISYKEMWKLYLLCIRTHQECIVGADIPPFVQRRTPVGNSDTIQLLISNTTNNTQRPPNATLVSSASISSNSDSITHGVKSLGLLAPGEGHALPISWTCTQVGNLVSNIVLATNATDPINLAGAVSVECYDDKLKPLISDSTPNPLSISAAVGQTATGTFSFNNSGDPGSTLHYTLTSSDLALTLSPTSGTLNAEQAASVSVSKLCEVAGTSTYTVTVGSTDVGVEAKTVQVNVECKASFDWPGYRPYPWEGTWRTQPVISYGRELCRYEAVGLDKNISRYILWLAYDPNWSFPSGRVPSFSGYETYNNLYNPETTVGQNQYSMLNGFDFGTGEPESAMEGAVARIIEAYKAEHPEASCK